MLVYIFSFHELALPFFYLKEILSPRRLKKKPPTTTRYYQETSCSQPGFAVPLTDEPRTPQTSTIQWRAAQRVSALLLSLARRPLSTSPAPGPKSQSKAPPGACPKLGRTHTTPQPSPNPSLSDPKLVDSTSHPPKLSPVRPSLPDPVPSLSARATRPDQPPPPRAKHPGHDPAGSADIPLSTGPTNGAPRISKVCRAELLTSPAPRSSYKRPLRPLLSSLLPSPVPKHSCSASSYLLPACAARGI